MSSQITTIPVEYIVRKMLLNYPKPSHHNLRLGQRGPTDRFRHLFIGGILELLRFVVMRCRLQQPLAFDFNHRPHVLLRRKHQLVVQHPTRQFFEQCRIRMDHHRLIVLGRFVVTPPWRAERRDKSTRL